MASIRQRGNACRARIRRQGRTLTKTPDTEAEAVAWVAAEEARIPPGGATALHVHRRPSGVTVAALFDRYAREVFPERDGRRFDCASWQRHSLSLPLSWTAQPWRSGATQGFARSQPQPSTGNST
jgi:hypothetical protein